MKVVARYREPWMAHIARGKLEANDIEAYVFDDMTVGVDWLYSYAIGGVRLVVPDQHEAEARVLLEAPEVPLESEDACPECGAHELTTSRYSLWSLIPSVFFGTPIFFPRRSWQCRLCGHRWRHGGAADAS